MSLASEFISSEAKNTQRTSLFGALSAGPVSTIEARERLGISHPAGRILELRRSGFRIDTKRIRAIDTAGRPHTSALYVLERSIP